MAGDIFIHFIVFFPGRKIKCLIHAKDRSKGHQHRPTLLARQEYAIADRQNGLLFKIGRHFMRGLSGHKYSLQGHRTGRMVLLKPENVG